MPFLFANPWGLLALLGVPAVLAVHFLHHHRKMIPVSTLFLVEIAREPAQTGRRWHRLLPSIPMWLQLLLVLLIATLLAKPYRPHGVLQVAIVVDDSASMRPFRAELSTRVSQLMERIERGGQRSEWHIYSANPAKPLLYSGENPSEWLETLPDWRPAESWRDPTDSLRLARNRVGVNGLVIHATDTPTTNLLTGVALMSVGQPIDNAGIAGVTTQTTESGTRWQAVLVNRSSKEATREWQLEWNGKQTTPKTKVTLPARGMTTIEGQLPDDATRLVLRLSKDAFALDDLYPFVRPAPKPLAAASIGTPPPAWLVDRLPRIIPRLSYTVPGIADFVMIGLQENASVPATTGLVFSSAGDRKAPFLKEIPVPTTHPLVDGLAWAGLAIQDVPAPPPLPTDEVLLWAGNRPLISLRMAVAPKPQAAEEEPTEAEQAEPETESDAEPAEETQPAPEPVEDAPPSIEVTHEMLPEAGLQLVFHFNPEHSSFKRLPAGAILLLRFAEMLRESKTATTWAQLEPGQSIRSLLPKETTGEILMEAVDATGKVLESHPLARLSRAPSEPSFLRVRDSQNILIEGAVAFADARESDFFNCAPADNTEAAIQKASRDSIPKEGALLPLLCLAALATLLALYHFQGISPKQADPDLQAEPNS